MNDWPGNPEHSTQITTAKEYLSACVDLRTIVALVVDRGLRRQMSFATLAAVETKMEIDFGRALR